jgi:hypothetical protein
MSVEAYCPLARREVKIVNNRCTSDCDQNTGEKNVSANICMGDIFVTDCEGRDAARLRSLSETASKTP